jgi:hypothetical protein
MIRSDDPRHEPAGRAAGGGGARRHSAGGPGGRLFRSAPREQAAHGSRRYTPARSRTPIWY